MKLCNRIRELRFQNGEMSQQQLADAVEVTRMTIYSIEKEKFVPSALLAFKIARALGKEITEVFYIEDETQGDEK
jgi:putative transcriptional regulator